MRTLSLLIGLMMSLNALAENNSVFKRVEVATGVYALIGPTTGRTAENHALNANMGFVVTPKGVVLIDSGATAKGAALIEQQIAEVTKQPVRWVINTGSQDHRWLGNRYFADKGAEIIALSRTVATQQSLIDPHMSRLENLLGKDLEGTTPLSAAKPLKGDHHTLELGGETLELHYYADAHWPGDIVIWHPASKTLFSGDHVYVDRILGIQASSNTKTWKQAFDQAMALAPKHIVPGHGGVCDVEKAQRETGDYLNYLVAGVGQALKDWKSLGETVEALATAPEFAHLEHFESWHRTNINRTYLRMEAE